MARHISYQDSGQSLKGYQSRLRKLIDWFLMLVWAISFILGSVAQYDDGYTGKYMLMNKDSI